MVYLYTHALSLGGQKVIFSKKVMLHVKLNRNKAEITIQLNILALYIPTAPRLGQKVNTIEEVNVAYQIKGKEV